MFLFFMATKLNAQWIVGFVDGVGCFHASLNNNQTIKNKVQIQIEFVVTQHKRDIHLLYALQSYFKCGQVSLSKGENSDTNCYVFRVRNLQHHLTKIIPFFLKHPLKTKKNIEFLRFRKLCMLSDG
jgi:hypothetical protein